MPSSQGLLKSYFASCTPGTGPGITNIGIKKEEYKENTQRPEQETEQKKKTMIAGDEPTTTGVERKIGEELNSQLN